MSPDVYWIVKASYETARVTSDPIRLHGTFIVKAEFFEDVIKVFHESSKTHDEQWRVDEINYLSESITIIGE